MPHVFILIVEPAPSFRTRVNTCWHPRSAVQRAAVLEDDTLSPRTQRKRVVLVAGPPAAGKGTQCDLIVRAYGLVLGCYIRGVRG